MPKHWQKALYISGIFYHKTPYIQTLIRLSAQTDQRDWNRSLYPVRKDNVWYGNAEAPRLDTLRHGVTDTVANQGHGGDIRRHIFLSLPFMGFYHEIWYSMDNDEL